MRGLQWLLVTAFICVQARYSFAVLQETFGTCATSDDCPDFATCITSGTLKKCKCDTGYDAIDLPFTSGGVTVTVCRDLGPCSPFDRVNTDCGTNGECVAYTDLHGSTAAFCKCQLGYYGTRCDLLGPSTSGPYQTTRSPYYTTRRPGNIGAFLPIIGGGGIFLIIIIIILAGLASTSG